MPYNVRSNADEWLAQVEGSPVLDLMRDLDTAAYEAAKAGVVEAQQDHPYTDRTQQLTNTAHPERVKVGESAMVWPMNYASFVDGRGYDQNAKSKGPYAFVPVAERAAEKELHRRVKEAIQNFASRLSIVRGNRFV